MQKLFQDILDNYLLLPKLVSNSSDVYDKLTRLLPNEISKILNRNDLIVKGSIGQGVKSFNPWISILNKNIAISTQDGLYICYLFRKDMRGFYLVLMQGITYFTSAYKSNKYKAAKLVGDYFLKEIADLHQFSNKPIDLNTDSNRGKGYEKTTIISKYYPSNKFSEDELIHDLKTLTNIYDEIVSYFSYSNYEDIVKEVLAYEDSYNNPKFNVDKASKLIKDVLDENGVFPNDFNRKLIQVVPKIDRTYKFRRLTNPILNKIDYLKKCKEDLRVGLLGEKLILSYEKERLIKSNLANYADKIEWVSSRSDSFGFDIKSFDLIDYKPTPIQIEVKSTSCKYDIEFPVSKSEVSKSKELSKTYFVYRLYNINSTDVKFYRVKGAIEDNFELDPITYLARYRGLINK